MAKICENDGRLPVQLSSARLAEKGDGRMHGRVPGGSEESARGELMAC